MEHTYEIGGICVTMTAEQAAAWNLGNITKEICDGAIVAVPKRSGARSFVRDGEVVVHAGMPHEDFVPLWEFIGGDEGDSAEYAMYMTDAPARLVR